MDPYIGITDFMDFGQVKDMSKVFSEYLSKGSRRKLHVGVMMSYKTLHDLPTKWQSAFPSKDTIAGIFSSHDTYNCLHYADYDSDPEFSKSLARAISYGGIGIHAIQLDMIWPDPDQVVNGIYVSRKQIEVILQIGKNALEEVGNDPQRVVERLGDYKGVIHRVLLDKSMGRGLGMNAVGLIPFVEAIKESFPMLGIGVAGGLGPKTMDLVKPLAERFSDLSIDAQGQLRPSGNALDPIDWSMAANYVIKALQLLV
ncbi:hypothetical protein HY967_04160 [Candidatus Jorgensenbacteria bacterium]|nr:hypothetical protein [Candidatus Jorgensenbacteria bacterium]